MNKKPSKLVKEVTNKIIKKYGEKWDISPRILKSRKVWWIPALIEVGNIVEKRAREEVLKRIEPTIDEAKAEGWNDCIKEFVKFLFSNEDLKTIKEKKG